MKINLLQKILISYLSLLFVFWIVLSFSGLQTSFWNYLYSFSFSLIPLLGGFYGLFIAKKWGSLKSAVGKAIFFISTGLLSWGSGSMIWSYYNFFQQVAAPYPSLADVGFILSLPFWAFGIIDLSKATGAKFGLRKKGGKILFILLPLLIIGLSYYLLVIVARGGILTQSVNDYLKLFLDLAYPIGDVVILTFALVVFGLSFNYFGGQYKFASFSLLLGFIFMYLADFIFSYTTTIETFYNGSFGDLMFTLALFLMTFGIFSFSKKPKYQT